MDARTLGALEWGLRFTPHGEGRETETVSTPGMWALADEWADGLRASGGHTDGWCALKHGQAVYLLAAQREGIMPAQPLSAEAIAELMNRYDVAITAGQGDDAPDPTRDGPEGGPAPA